MEKILIFGASSFIGTHIACGLRDEFSVFGSYARHPVSLTNVKMFGLDLVPNCQALAITKTIRPSAVIYAAGRMDHRVCTADPLGTLYLHSELPVALCRQMEEWGGRFIYLSTSKVFSGERGGYTEDDATDATGPYGRSKREGEERLLESPNATILRLGTIYGMGFPHQESALLSRMWRQIMAGAPTACIDNEKRSFMSVDNVVAAVKKVVTAPSIPTGLFHLASREVDTYYGLAVAWASALGKLTHPYFPVSGEQFRGERATAGGPRGNDLSLDGTRFSDLFRMNWESNTKALSRSAKEFGSGLIGSRFATAQQF